MVDQYERLYTDCAAAERRRFTELLLLLAAGTVKVVIGLRADFYDLALADLGERLADGQVALAPMNEQDLSRAVTEPARKLLRSFQPGLAQQIVTDVRGRPGDLPLLQFALTELWESDAPGGVLTRETYEGLGALPDGARLPGAQGALISRAEQLWQDLSPDEQLRLQRILFGLIAVQAAGDGAASRVGSLRDISRPALLAQWDDDDQRLIRQLTDARLLTAARSPAGDRAAVEVSHEVLLRAWPRLRGWLERHAEFVQWRARDLSPHLERWLDNGKRAEFLLPRSLLDPALRWLKDYPDGLTGPAAGYIQASKRHRTRRGGLIIGGVAIVTAAALAASYFFFLRQAAVSAQQTAVRNLQVAESNLMLIENPALQNTDSPLASLLSVESWRLHKSNATRYAMLSTAAQVQTVSTVPIPGLDQADSAALSPNGQTIAIAKGNTLQVREVATAHQVGRTITIRGAAEDVSDPITFSQDDKTVAVASVDLGGGGGTVQLFDIATGKQIGPAITVSDAETAHSIAFSQDGETLAVASSMSGIAISASGSPVAASGDTIQLWDIATGKQIGSAITLPNVETANSMAFGQNDKTLAVATDDTLRLLNVAYLAAPAQYLCASAGRSLSHTEWARYAPGLPYQTTCTGEG